MSAIRILILADDPLVRAGLATTEQAGLHIAGQEHSGVDLLAAIDLYQPDAILWDVGWDPDRGALRTLCDRFASLAAFLPPTIGLLPAQHSVEIARQLREAGVRGLLLRSAKTLVLAAALTAVTEGLVVFDPDLLDALPPASQPQEPARPETLTPREMEVLRLLAEGLPNKNIAQRLGVSEHTVKFHINAIMGKLGAQSRTEAVVRATRAGLILL